MKSRLLLIVGLLWLAIAPARADYFINQGSQTPIKAGVVGSAILPYSQLVDYLANPFGVLSNPIYGAMFGPTPIGSIPTTPPVLIGGTSDGTTLGTVGVLKVLGGVGFINCANCSGSGISVAFAGPIGTVGTPGGFKDSSGNFQPFIGDVTNGQHVSIQGTLPSFASVQHFICDSGCTGGGGGGGTSSNFSSAFPTAGTAIGVSNGTNMVPITLGQALSASSIPVVLPAAQITALTPPTSVGISGTLPAYAATPTFNLGTLNGAALAANQTGGNQKTQIVDGSGNIIASTSNALNVNVVAGGGANASVSTTGSAVPASGTYVGMNVAGTLTGLVGTANGLKVDGSAVTQPVSGTVTANAGTNLNTSALALETGGNLATLVTDTGSPGATACTTDTASCNQNQQLQRIAQRLSTVNTTLGTPFQAGGSIGNTSFAATQATASSLNATVVGTGTFAVQAAQSGTWNVTNISGTVSLPTGAATAANQTSVIGTVAGGTAAANSLLTGGQFNSTPITVTNAQQAALQVDANGYLKVNVVVGGGGTGGTASTFGATFPTLGTAAGMSQAGNMVAMTGTSGNLNVQCANCSGSGASALDAATFTAGSSVFAPTGGEFTSGGATACVTGHQCIAAITADRATFANIADIAGTAVLTGTGAVGSGAQRVAIGTDTATIAGSAPGTAGAASANVLTVQGVASMTPVQVSQATAASLNATVVGTGTFAVQAAQSGTWNITNISGTISLPTGASTSANQPTNAAIASTTSGQTGNLHFGAVTTAAPTYTTGQSDPLSLTTAGALRVDGSAVTQPVSLTSTTITGSVAVTNAGTFAVQLSGATNNINNIAGTVSLPTGASTAALQPTNAAQGSTTSGQTGPLMQAAVLTAAPTYTTAQTSPMTMTTGGALRVADASVVTALGTPFQAGGSIGNTSFAATQATAANLNATVVGTGTFAVQATLQASATTAIGKVDPNTIGNWGLQVSTQNSATPTNGMLSLGQFNTAPTTITSGNVSPLQVDNTGHLLVNCTTGCSSSTAQQGPLNAATATATNSGIVGGQFLSTQPTMTNTQQAAILLSSRGELLVASGVSGFNVTNAGTFAVQAAQSGSWTTTVTQATGTNLHMVCDSGCSGSGGTSSTFGSAFPTAGTAIGLTNGTNMIAWSATTNYGTSPGAIAVPAVNASVTNSITIGTNAALVAGSAIVGKMGIDQTTPGTTNGVQVNAALPAGTNVVGFTSNDPCSQGTKLGASISLTSSGQIIAGTSGKKTFICAISFVGTTAGSVAVVEGTGTVCATNIFGLIGGTTAAIGLPTAATGGIALGSGDGTIVSPSADANATAANVCLLLNSTGQTSGHVSYVQQ